MIRNLYRRWRLRGTQTYVWHVFRAEFLEGTPMIGVWVPVR